MIEGEKLDQPKEGGTTDVDKKISDLQADFQLKLDAMKEEYEKKLSGRDRSYTQLKKELEDKEALIQTKEKEGLSEIEKMSLTIQQEKEAREQFERELKLERHRNKAISLLDETGLPKEYLDFVKLDSEESIAASVESLGTVWSKQKEAYAQEFAKNNGTKNPTVPSSAAKKPWKEMTMSERTALHIENPELARQMMDTETPRR